MATAIVLHAPRPQAMPSAALIHTVAAVVNPSTVPAAAFRRMTPAPMKLMPPMTPWMMPCTTQTHGVRVLGHPRHLDAGDAYGGSSKGDEAQRSHSDRLARKITIETDHAAGERGGTEANNDIVPFNVHAACSFHHQPPTRSRQWLSTVSPHKIIACLHAEGVVIHLAFHNDLLAGTWNGHCYLYFGPGCRSSRSVLGSGRERGARGPLFTGADLCVIIWQ